MTVEHLAAIHHKECKSLGWLRATARMGKRAELAGLNIEVSGEEARKRGWMI